MSAYIKLHICMLFVHILKQVCCDLLSLNTDYQHVEPKINFMEVLIDLIFPCRPRW